MDRSTQLHSSQAANDGGDRSRSVTELIPELGSEVMRLMQSEADLLRAEINEKVEKAQTAVGSMAAGGVCLLAALLVLLQALVVALTNLGMGAGWASLLVGAVVAVIGVALLGYGSSKTKNMAPDRTITEARRTTDMVREKSS